MTTTSGRDDDKSSSLLDWLSEDLNPLNHIQEIDDAFT